MLALGLLGFCSWPSGLPRLRAPEARPLLALGLPAVGVLVLILLNPARVQEARHRPAADGGLSARRVPEHEPGNAPSAGRRRPATDRAAARAAAQDRRPPIQRYGFGRELTAISDNDAPSVRRPMKRG